MRLFSKYEAALEMILLIILHRQYGIVVIGTNSGTHCLEHHLLAL